MCNCVHNAQQQQKACLSISSQLAYQGCVRYCCDTLCPPTTFQLAQPDPTACRSSQGWFSCCCKPPGSVQTYATERAHPAGNKLADIPISRHQLTAPTYNVEAASNGPCCPLLLKLYRCTVQHRTVWYNQHRCYCGPYMHAATTAIFLPALLQGVLLLGGSGPSTRMLSSYVRVTSPN